MEEEIRIHESQQAAVEEVVEEEKRSNLESFED